MVLVYGEILIDMNCDENSNKINYFVGGAPFNVAYSINKFEQDVVFIGSVGNDYFGKKIVEFIDSCGIDSKYTSLKDNKNTTLAIVSNDANGERYFSFMRNNSADYSFSNESLSLIEKADIVHVGSLMISEKEGFAYAKKIIKKANEFHKVISFDINFRSDIFKSKDECLKRYKYIYSRSDILKLSIDELYMFTGIDDLDKALKAFVKPNQKVFITLGKDGSLLYYKNKKYYASSINVNCVDTTGAGDAFYGTMLGIINEVGYDDFFKDEQMIVKGLKIANVQGAFATEQKGALSSIRSKKEILKEVG